ncbi:MAG TPA: 16S rRNA (adenine(1518)-N(6)/adenine(1519)-N(6))-dimethyltransferase RsmA [Candidatus Paceibacterota bacterium]
MTYAKKSLGQNFLRSKSALRAMVEAGKIREGEMVLEIGPGRGALTEKLLEAGASVVAVEKDEALIPILREKFAKEISEKRFFLIHADILDLSASDILKANKLTSSQAYKLIANIPYYITGAVIRKFLEEKNPPKIMVLLLQKEVVERIVARDGKESILSIAVKAYCRPRYVMKVKREAFSPAPNVDSAIVAFEDISKKFFTENKINEEKFFALVKTGFAHKRKKLGGNLKKLSKNLNQDVLANLKDKRAEELSPDDWRNLLAKN